MSLPLVRNPNLAWREIEGEIVIISPQDSQVHELNETAGVIWKHADGATTLEEIAADVATEFEVDVNDARADIIEMIRLLREKQLLLDSSSKMG